MDFPPPPSALWAGQAPSPEKSSQVLIRDYPHPFDRHRILNPCPHPAPQQDYSDGPANGSLNSAGSARFHGGNTAHDNVSSKCIVSFSSLSPKLLEEYRPLIPRPVYGTLGLISIDRDVFLCVITQASRVATVRPGETVEKIEAVQFFCLNSSDYDDVISVDPYDLDSAAPYGQNLGRREFRWSIHARSSRNC